MELKSQRLKNVLISLSICSVIWLFLNGLLAWEKGQSITECDPAPSEMVFLAEGDSSFLPHYSPFYNM